MRVEAPSPSTGWCRVRPEATDRLADLGLRTARDFLALPGVVVGGHVGRNVSRVDLGGTVGYLKREHSVRWRDRWRNLLAGFGPSSMSRREWSVLQRLEANDLPGPTWLACGEADGQAFLLLEGVADATEIRRLGRIDGTVAAELGRGIGRIHSAGMDQPDLFAKHFLIEPPAGRITILDWQRAVPRAEVSRNNRIEALGTFLASCPPEMLGASERRSCLQAYLDIIPDADTIEFVRQVDRAAERLSGRPNLRSQRVVPAAEQELVRIFGEMACAVPDVAEELAEPGMIGALYNPVNDGQPFRFRDGRIATLRVHRYVNPVGRWFQAVRGKAWRSAELKTARLLFHLERHGIGAPRLMAYGQAVFGLSAGSFVLAEPPPADPIGPAHGPLLRDMFDRLNASGCVLAAGRLNASDFGVVEGRAVVVHPSGLRLCRTPSRRQIARVRSRLAAMFGTAP